MTQQQINNFIEIYCKRCGTQRCPGPSYNMRENKQEDSFCNGCPHWQQYLIICDDDRRTTEQQNIDEYLRKNPTAAYEKRGHYHAPIDEQVFNNIKPKQKIWLDEEEKKS